MPQAAPNYPLCIFKGSSTPAGVVPRTEVQLELNDLGLIRGYGVFDYLRTYSGQPFRLPDYLDRFARSAGLLGMELPVPQTTLGDLVHELIGATRGTNPHDYGLRFLLTGGPSVDGFSRSDEPTLIVLIENISPPNPRDIELGVKLISCEYLRDLPEAKTTNYLNAVRLYPLMKREGAAEILYCWQGEVLEASRANLFALFGDTLVTPAQRILLGNTRKTVLELAADSFAIEERTLTVAELREATELFISGSGRMVTPVVAVDTLTVGSGRPGPNTRTLIQRFNAFSGFQPPAS